MKTRDKSGTRGGPSWLGSSLLALLIMALAAGAGTYAYHAQRRVVRERTLQALSHLVFYKTLRVKEWHQQTLQSARRVADAPALTEILAKDDLRSAGMGKRVCDELGGHAKSAGFAAWGLLDRTGALIPSTSGGDGRLLSKRPVPSDGWPPSEPTMSPLYALAGGPVHFDVVVPLARSSRSDAPWAAVFAVDPWSTLFTVMAFAPADFSTLQTGLLQGRGSFAEYLAPLGSGKDQIPPLRLRVPLVSGSPAQFALDGRIVSGEGRDYRGSRVLYATNYVPKVSWGVLGTIEERDAYSALRFSAGLVAGISLLAVLAAAAFLYAWWNRRHNLVTQRLLQTLLEHQNTLKETVHKLFTAQEEERRKISHQLHDGLAQSIGCARMLLATLDRGATEGDDPRASHYLKQARDSLADAESECRAIIGRYRPPELDRLGLSSAIRGLGASLAPARVRFEILEGAALTGLPQEVSLAAFRIAQEALSNVRKHAHCTEVRVELHVDDRGLHLEIEDDGRGIDMSRDPAPLHFGLIEMHELAALLGGTCELEGHPGQGTRIRVRIPIRERGTSLPEVPRGV